MKIANVSFAPGRRLTRERRTQESLVLNVRRQLAQSVYLLSVISAMVGWIWLLTSVAIELFSL